MVHMLQPLIEMLVKLFFLPQNFSFIPNWIFWNYVREILILIGLSEITLILYLFTEVYNLRDSTFYKKFSRLAHKYYLLKGHHT